MAKNLAEEIVQLGALLAKFQLIELGLKIFITRNNFDESRLKGQHSKTHSTLDLNNMTLGDALKKIKKKNLIKNESLIKKLTSLKKDRDFIAHKGFLMVSSLPEKDKKFFVGNEVNPLNYQQLNVEIDEVIYLLRSEYLNT